MGSGYLSDPRPRTKILCQLHHLTLVQLHRLAKEQLWPTWQHGVPVCVILQSQRDLDVAFGMLASAPIKAFLCNEGGSIFGQNLRILWWCLWQKHSSTGLTK